MGPEEGSRILTETRHSVTSERAMKSLHFFKLSPSFRDFTFVGCFLLIAALWVTGCGPIQSTQAIGEGTAAVEQAKASASETFAPYHFHRAKVHLYWAKTKSGFAEYEISREYARRAKADAEKAQDYARKRFRLQQILNEQPGEEP